ncbi:MAG: SGNH/GDSL hydrolase family protein, partial [Clostridiales bacterium]|nr:SGNH/GDSL hydrolase family protein [Clostridiales bacterium]
MKRLLSFLLSLAVGAAFFPAPRTVFGAEVAYTQDSVTGVITSPGTPLTEDNAAAQSVTWDADSGGTVQWDENKEIRIMLLGDSISNKITTNPWRAMFVNAILDDSLAGTGPAVDFVGTQYTAPPQNDARTDGGKSVYARDTNREAYDGAFTSTILNDDGAYKKAAANVPDVVMIHLGTNDLPTDRVDTTLKNIQQIIWDMRRAKADIIFVVSQTIKNHDTPNEWKFNARLPWLARNNSLPQSPILVADQFSGISLQDLFAPEAYGPHPNWNGSELMTARYLKLMRPVLQGVLPANPQTLSSEIYSRYAEFSAGIPAGYVPVTWCVSDNDGRRNVDLGGMTADLAFGSATSGEAYQYHYGKTGVVGFAHSQNNGGGDWFWDNTGGKAGFYKYVSGAMPTDTFTVQGGATYTVPRFQTWEDFAAHEGAPPRGASAFSGDTVNVVAIGGSLTAGNGAGDAQNAWFGDNDHPGVFGAYLKNLFPEKTVNLYNAGIGGTGSNYGYYRLEKDVISRNPDFVIVEFAVNDRNDAPATVKRHMEGIVRQLLRLPKVPYIMFLYTADLHLNNCAAVHNEVAAAYGIPALDLGAYLGAAYTLEQRKAFYADWQSDSVHPNADGYAVWANYMVSQFTQDGDAFFAPSNLNGVNGEAPYFDGATPLGAPAAVPIQQIAKASEGWSLDCPAHPRWNAGGGRWVDHFWSEDAIWCTSENGAELEFWFTGQRLGVVSEGHANSADLELWVDGVLKDTFTARGGGSEHTYFYAGTPFAQGWHKGKIKLNDAAAGRDARIKYICADRDSLSPPTVTANAAGGQTIPATDGTALVPPGTQEFALIFDRPADFTVVNPEDYDHAETIDLDALGLPSLNAPCLDAVGVKVGGADAEFRGVYDVSGTYDATRYVISLASAIAEGTRCEVTIGATVSSQGVAAGTDAVLLLAEGAEQAQDYELLHHEDGPIVHNGGDYARVALGKTIAAT